MKIKPALIVLAAVFFVFIFSFAAFSQEHITITTYYPSPYGSYRELRAQRMAIGDNYSGSSYCWPPDTCANQINADADLVVEGKVGIGTANPSAKLEIAGTDNTDLLALPAQMKLTYRKGVGPLYGFNIVPPIGGDDSFFLHTEEGGYHQVLYFGDGSDTYNVFGIATKTTATNWDAKFVVNQNGDVGIGTATPAKLLHLKANYQYGEMIRLDRTEYPTIIDDTFAIGVSVPIGYGPDADFMYLGKSPTTDQFYRNTLNITAAGNVGIGTMIPQAKLDVNGDIQVTGNLWGSGSDPTWVVNDGGAGFGGSCPEGTYMVGIDLGANVLTLRCRRL